MAPDLSIDREFRRGLQRLTDDLYGDRRIEQLSAIPNLASQYHRSIKIVTPFDPSHDYVCYQYAFGIEIPPPVMMLIQERDPRLRLDRQFVTFLINNHLSTPNVDANSIVIYTYNSVIQHAGLLRDGRVESKWGEAHLWDHAVFDVPESYGDSVVPYAPLPVSEVVAAFVKYARERRGDAFIDEIISKNDPGPPG